MVLYPLRMQCRAFPNDNTLRRSSGQASALLSTSIRKASFLIFIAAGGDCPSSTSRLRSTLTRSAEITAEA
ncbi:MAG: hypothetical protein EWV76_21235 [Microcystis novacekii Mn_MB_F_20050700_S1]|uniref:Uncharacterized protein n=1 Tax=Microcystis novacekii Mn_MB_F_20050700_S1D TaxID=2486266 RepID=A0A552IUA8_9CHRO|nr:MAG: hypothetical protein EWV76_21235 [Microcystis novacekii Mn_MB_F_20050700_S1]TRU87075.1 MAG: hypothetical protein EWV54_13150 [Microcystis novacekii Mn_MB_F_20050700_S1D]